MGTEKAVDVKSCVGMKWQSLMTDNQEGMLYFILNNFLMLINAS